jgi:hypothetical protein
MTKTSDNGDRCHVDFLSGEKKHFHFIRFIYRFEILNFGHWNLFDIWCLYFVI